MFMLAAREDDRFAAVMVRGGFPDQFHHTGIARLIVEIERAVAINEHGDAIDLGIKLVIVPAVPVGIAQIPGPGIFLVGRAVFFFEAQDDRAPGIKVFFLFCLFNDFRLLGQLVPELATFCVSSHQSIGATAFPWDSPQTVASIISLR